MAIDITEHLASALGRRDEEPNIALAQAIISTKDSAAIQQLVDQLSAKDKACVNDCIKVLYEVGERQAALIAPHLDVFVGSLGGKNNRLQWGAMTAIHCISKVDPVAVYVHLPAILAAADKGSVITRDQAVNTLIALAREDAFHDDCMDLLEEQLLSCPTNQLPMYAERVLPVIQPDEADRFMASLHSRLDAIEKESKRKRIEKVIRKLAR